MECTAGYAPLYLFGMLLGRSRVVRRTMLDEWRGPAALLAVTALGYAAWRVAGPAVAGASFVNLDEVARFAVAAVAPPPAVG